MQIDGEYFAVKWPQRGRVFDDTTMNVLRRSAPAVWGH
jgi:hypothetical protein